MHTFTFLTHLPTNSSEKASLILPACPEHTLPRSETGAKMSPASIRTEAGQSCEHGTISANGLFQERRGEKSREVTTASWGGGQVPRHCTHGLHSRASGRRVLQQRRPPPRLLTPHTGRLESRGKTTRAGEKSTAGSARLAESAGSQVGC